MSEIKEQLIKSVIALLDDGFDVEELTIRQIAYEAHISTGLINYHFGSKWNLIVAAISSIIDGAAAEAFQALSNLNDSPKQQLRAFLKAMAIVVCKYQKYTSVLIRDEIISNRFSTPETIVGLLKEIKPELSEKEIKYLAIQVVAPIQYVFLKEHSLRSYLGEEQDKPHTIALDDYEEIMEVFLKTLGI
jgi:AcrR family transcriptional regulator